MPIRPTRAEIDLGALTRNLETLHAAAPGIDVLAVVKADAYGHGAVPVSGALEAAGVRFLGVALVEEGLALRQAGMTSDILVLGGAYDGGWDAMLEHRMIPVVFRPEHLTALDAAAGDRGVTARAHLKVDTGMGRLGVLPGELPAFLEAARGCRRVSLEGLCSHFANADLADAALTAQQIARFRTALGQMRAAGFDPRWRHLSNSAGVLALPEARDGVEMNLARPGLMPVRAAARALAAAAPVLEPVLSWKTAVVHLKSVPTGTPISYGSTWTAPRPRASPRCRWATRTAGRVCCPTGRAVLVPGSAGAHRGPRVHGHVHGGRHRRPRGGGRRRGGAPRPAGRGGPGRAGARRSGGTIAYDVLCAIGARVPRVVVGR